MSRARAVWKCACVRLCDVPFPPTPHDKCSVVHLSVPGSTTPLTPHAHCSAAAAGVPCKVLQGNLDPIELFGDEASIRAATATMLAQFGSEQPLIANLGHGMMPAHKPEALRAFFQTVHDVSTEMRAGGWEGCA